MCHDKGHRDGMRHHPNIKKLEQELEFQKLVEKLELEQKKERLRNATPKHACVSFGGGF